MWTQVVNLKRELKKYQKATGKKQAEVAAELGTSYATLRFWLSGTRRPELATLQRMAALFGCSVMEFIDDPSGVIVGQDLSDESEHTRFFARLMVKAVSGEGLTDEDQEQIWKAAQREREWIMARKARHPGSGS